MNRSFKYRLFLNRKAHIKLGCLLESARTLYNCALEQRIVCWNQRRKAIYYKDQAAELKEMRKNDSEFAKLSCSVAQNTLKRLDWAFASFFRRLRSGDAPGFPRFKGTERFCSITFPAYGDGIKLKGGKLYVRGVGLVRIKMHRNLEGTIKTVTIKRKNGKYYASFSCNNIAPRTLKKSFNQIGIDVGIKSFATMSNGEHVPNPKHLRRSESKLKILQRQHSKKQSTRTHRKLAALHEVVSNQRKDFLHKTSRQIINRYGYIFIENLKTKDIIGKNGRVLNKYINDAAWTTFFNLLSYKAEDAGRTIIRVDPANTTQMCSRCGTTVTKDLSVRTHACQCGLIIDRDINAALNILALGRSVCESKKLSCV